MTRIIASPSRYVQGKGELSRLYQHVSNLGKKMFIIVSESGKKRVEGLVAKSLDGTEGSAVYFIFGGECSKNEIKRIQSAYRTAGCDLIVGIGGGKILDAAKASAYYEGCPVIIAPTAASTDAPCSALSVLYTDSGVFEEYLFLPSSPNMVLVDTEIVSKAPARLLVSGIGDALATYFEAREMCIRDRYGTGALSRHSHLFEWKKQSSSSGRSPLRISGPSLSGQRQKAGR